MTQISDALLSKNSLAAFQQSLLDQLNRYDSNSIPAPNLPKLHTAQAQIVNDPARFKVVCCGRRFGKTELAVYRLSNEAHSGLNVAYFAPTYKMLTEVWRRLKTVLRDSIRYKNETERRIELTTGGTIDCWSLENADSVRGRKYHGVVVDEAAMIPYLSDKWSESLTPLLTDYQGWALFFSTPKGHNDFWRLYIRGLDPAFPDWQAWQYPTSSNPYIPADEIELQRSMLPSRSFEQEYLAEFVDDAGGVFRGVSDVCTLPRRTPYSGDFAVGVDWAKSHDFTVISVIDRNTRQQVHIDRFNQVSWEVQRGRLIDIYRQWKPTVIYAESNSIGEPNIEALRREGVPVQPFETTALSKTPLIDSLALAIERKEITLLDDPVQRAELQAYQMERLPSGKYRYNAPDGSHDDTVMALALAYHGCYTSKRLLLWE